MYNNRIPTFMLLDEEYSLLCSRPVVVLRGEWRTADSPIRGSKYIHRWLWSPYINDLPNCDLLDWQYKELLKGDGQLLFLSEGKFKPAALFNGRTSKTVFRLVRDMYHNTRSCCLLSDDEFNQLLNNPHEVHVVGTIWNRDCAPPSRLSNMVYRLCQLNLVVGSIYLLIKKDKWAMGRYVQKTDSGLQFEKMLQAGYFYIHSPKKWRFECVG